MAITPSDVRLYASERMTDNADGGGRMSGTVIVDGADNNAFPDVTDIERLTGRVALRKMFGAVLSTDTDTYLSAHMLLDDVADDTAVTGAIFASGNYVTERAAVVAQLFGMDLAGSSTVSRIAQGGSAYLWNTFAEPSPPPATPGPTYVVGFCMIQGTGINALRWIIDSRFETYAPDGFSRGRYELNAALPGSGYTTVTVTTYTTQAPIASRMYGMAEFAASAIATATAVVVDTVFTRVLPLLETSAYPQVASSADAPWPTWGLSGPTPTQLLELQALHGNRQFIKPNDPLLLHDTQSMAPATVSNGQTVNTGRTTLARVRVIGNSGVEHARFTRGVTSVLTNITCDLDAGTVTFVNVAGLSQPVTVEHRIEEMALVSSLAPVSNGVQLNLNRGLARAFPATARASSLLMLGDLQGRVVGGFALATWAGVWNDTLGSSATPAADFNRTVYPIVTTNKGAITERWALVFTNTTTFRCIGETIGEITGGSIGVDFSPINPATGSPYFTVPAAGLGTGWTPQNAYRFNTVGAAAPDWVLRCIAPSVPGGADSVTQEFRGYVNA